MSKRKMTIWILELLLENLKLKEELDSVKDTLLRVRKGEVT